MSIDQFTKEQFEQVLDNIMPLGWQSLGMELNEYCYIIEVNANARIHIRSSIGESGIADKVGKDSIRLNLEVYQPDFRRSDNYKWIALPKKAITSQRWVTRVPGWERRLEEKVRLYWNVAKEFRQPIEFCSCGKAPFVGLSKSEKNSNRPYSSCLQKHGGCGLFIWLDKPIAGGIEFDSVPLQSTDETISSSNREETQAEKSMQDADSQPEDTVQNDNPEKDTDRECLSEVLENSEEDGMNNEDNSIQVSQQENEVASIPDEALSGNDISGNVVVPEGESPARIDKANDKSTGDSLFDNGGSLHQLSEEKEPNPKQLEAITAPVNSNIRVLAPPGSGKTFIIEQRYKYLVDNGIDPDSILVVTFSKSMADEMASRMNACAPVFESGMVWCPETRWSEEVIEECASFPNGEHDDLADSMTQAILRFRQGGFIRTRADYEDDDIHAYRRRKEYY
jgi:hypothetical protein